MKTFKEILIGLYLIAETFLISFVLDKLYFYYLPEYGHYKTVTLTIVLTIIFSFIAIFSLIGLITLVDKNKEKTKTGI